jgi:hypothetical protein
MSEPRYIAAFRMVVVAVSLLVTGAARGEPTAEEKLEARARGLLHRWLATQNGGDFGAYRALYASGFHGIRRSGSRTVRLDLKAWLRDRKRMFGKPQRVAAARVQVSPLADGKVEIQFTQSYRSGGYEDEGPKRMAFLPAGPDLAIVYEELLESRTSPALGEARFVEAGRIVLERSPARALGSGAIEKIDDGEGHHLEAFEPVAAGRLPARLAGEVGRRYSVMDLDDLERAPCVVRVTGLRIWYRGRLEHDDQKASTPDLDLVEDGQRLLVAEVAGGCPISRGWAYPDPLPVPSAFKGEAAPPGAHLQVIDALVRARDRLPPGFPAELDFWKARCHLLGAERFHAVEYGVPIDLLLHSADCEKGRETTRVWSLWIVDGEQLRLRDAGTDPQWLLGYRHWKAADLNGDGRLDFFGGFAPLLEKAVPGAPRSAFDDAGLFSSPAGYTFGPTQIAPPPVLIWEYEPGC